MTAIHVWLSRDPGVFISTSQFPHLSDGARGWIASPFCQPPNAGQMVKCAPELEGAPPIQHRELCQGNADGRKTDLLESTDALAPAVLRAGIIFQKKRIILGNKSVGSD